MSAEKQNLLEPAAAASRTPDEAAQSLAYFTTAQVGKLSAETVSRYAGMVRKALDDGGYLLESWCEKLDLKPENPLGLLVLQVLEGKASENDVVLEASKKLETLLKTQFSAEGRGLHECVSSVERRLPEKLVKVLRWIASLRNAVVHEDGSRLESVHARAQYALQAARCWDWLGKDAESSSPASPANPSGRRVRYASPEEKAVENVLVLGIYLYGFFSLYSFAYPSGSWASSLAPSGIPEKLIVLAVCVYLSFSIKSGLLKTRRIVTLPLPVEKPSDSRLLLALILAGGGALSLGVGFAWLDKGMFSGGWWNFPPSGPHALILVGAGLFLLGLTIFPMKRGAS
ncbi:MAG: hypothetical protein WCY67_09005 [Acidithiobacillus sp.]